MARDEYISFPYEREYYFLNLFCCCIQEQVVRRNYRHIPTIKSVKELTMGYYADCYVLTNNRTKKFVDEFLNTFIPNRKEQTNAYEIPQYSKETDEQFDSADKLIQHLELSINTPYTIYWENLDNNEPHFANCFFTNDNNLIVGLACNANDKTERELLLKLMEHCGSRDGYIAYEQPPPCNTDNFMEIVRRSPPTKAIYNK